MEGKKKNHDVLSDSEIKSMNIPIYQRPSEKGDKQFGSKQRLHQQKKEYAKVNVTGFLEDNHELNLKFQSVWTKDLIEKRGKLVAKRLEELL